jgi:hypothetical protein
LAKPNGKGKNLGAIGNILGTASRNRLGTRKKHRKIHVPPLPKKKTPKNNPNFS